MAIEHATIRSDVWTTMNAAVAAATGSTVKSKFPDDSTKLTKASLPMIVQRPAEVKTDEKVFGTAPQSKEIDVFFEIYALNPAQIDSISDQISNYFETTSVTDVHIKAINDSDIGTLETTAMNISFRIMNISLVYM